MIHKAGRAFKNSLLDFGENAKNNANSADLLQKEKSQQTIEFAGFSGMAEEVGFEPTCHLRDNLISSQGRYNHFDTPP